MKTDGQRISNQNYFVELASSAKAGTGPEFGLNRNHRNNRKKAAKPTNVGDPSRNGKRVKLAQ